MHFITNGCKHFSKTNSSDPRQRVPKGKKRIHSYLNVLITFFGIVRHCLISYSCALQLATSKLPVKVALCDTRGNLQSIEALKMDGGCNEFAKQFVKK